MGSWFHWLFGTHHGFTITCYFPAETPLLINIEREPDDYVVEVLEAIRAKLHSHGRTDIKYNDLCLFKTDIPLQPKESLQLRALQWLEWQPGNRKLQETELLSMIFPNGPHPVNDTRLDIIVANTEVLEMIDTTKQCKHLTNLSSGPSVTFAI